jgi:hypothetical protein
MAKNKTRKMTREELDSSAPLLEASHPLFKRGFVVGIKNASHFPTKTKEKPSSSETEKPDEKESLIEKS